MYKQCSLGYDHRINNVRLLYGSSITGKYGSRKEHNIACYSIKCKENSYLSVRLLAVFISVEVISY